MNGIQVRLDYADAVAQWFAELGGARIEQGALEDALKCTHIAASIMCRQNRTLASPALETNLLKVAAHLPGCRPARQTASAAGNATEGCLHVVTEALPAGGVTSMATRWMLNDQSGRQHHVALLAQHAPVPEALAKAARLTGGEVHLANAGDSFIARAAWLRNLANEVAGHVVLHVDVSDVISGAAFGVSGGPGVLLVNHTAHVHWIGASVTDLIVNCRGSALEGVWAATHRGVPRYATIPIPLDEPASPNVSGARDLEAKRRAREHLGVPHDAVVILTVGARFKYLPLGELDFVGSCERVLEELPGAIVLAVGFDADERWSAASRRTGSRIRTLGRLTQAELAAVHAASDIYIEGFPFGTTTSLLESGLRGLPVVLAPAVAPPPFGSDGVALDDVIGRPATVVDYEREIVRLGKDVAAREREGDTIRRSIGAHHIGPGWRQHLAAALNALPKEHATHVSLAPQRTPAAIHEYWFRFQSQWASGYEQILENAVLHAYSAGLKPRLNAAVLQACRNASVLRAYRSIPVPLLVCLCNYLLPLLPAVVAGKIFRVFAFLFRSALLSRISRRLRQLLGGTPAPAAPYEEYRRAPDVRR